jgi:hypothetical protein
MALRYYVADGATKLTGNPAGHKVQLTLHVHFVERAAFEDDIREGGVMFDMQVWQQIAIALVAVASVGWMSLALVRLFSRSASGKAIVRKATATESGLISGTIPEGAQVFDGWSYRVGARFAGRVRIAVYEDRVAVAGPRTPRGLYEVWMWVQGLLLALVPPAVVAAVIALDWRWLVAAVAIFIVSFGISIGGAGLWPGLGEVLSEKGHFKALEFPRACVDEVDVGKGWAKGGLEVVLFPYKAGVDKMADGLAVSFFAPDEAGREVRFAVDMNSREYARELSELLAGTATGKAT